MIINKKQARELANLILELCDNPGDNIDLRKSFKRNIKRTSIEIPNKFKFKAKGKEQAEFIKAYIEKYHYNRYSNSLWKSEPETFYLFIENSNYIAGSIEAEAFKGYELITYEVFEEYVNKRIEDDNYPF